MAAISARATDKSLVVYLDGLDGSFTGTRTVVYYVRADNETVARQSEPITFSGNDPSASEWEITGLMPGTYYNLGASVTPTGGETIALTGYGKTTYPAKPTIYYSNTESTVSLEISPGDGNVKGICYRVYGEGLSGEWETALGGGTITPSYTGLSPSAEYTIEAYAFVYGADGSKYYDAVGGIAKVRFTTEGVIDPDEPIGDMYLTCGEIRDDGFSIRLKDVPIQYGDNPNFYIEYSIKSPDDEYFMVHSLFNSGDMKWSDDYTSTEVWLGDVIAGTRYSVKVKILDSSWNVCVATEPTELVTPPKWVWINDTISDYDSITIILGNEDVGNFDGYYIKVGFARDADTGHILPEYYIRDPYYLYTTDNTIIIDELEPNKSYTIQIYRFIILDGKYYYGDFDTSWYDTLYTKPDPVETVTYTRGYKEVTAKWSEPSSGDFTHYYIYLYNSNKELLAEYNQASYFNRSKTIKNLSYATTYYLTIKTYNRNSPEGQQFSDPTTIEVYTAPSCPTLKSYTNNVNSVIINWTLADVNPNDVTLYINLYANGDLNSEPIKRSSLTIPAGTSSGTSLIDYVPKGTYTAEAATYYKDARCVGSDGKEFTAYLYNINITDELPSIEPWSWSQEYELTDTTTGTICPEAYIPMDETGFHPVTAVEWNDFTDRINQARAHKGGAQFEFTHVRGASNGSENPTEFTPRIYNEAAEAIGVLGGYVSNISSGTELTAQLFIDLRDELNTIINSL